MKNRWISTGVLAAMLMALVLVLSGCFSALRRNFTRARSALRTTKI